MKNLKRCNVVMLFIVLAVSLVACEKKSSANQSNEGNNKETEHIVQVDATEATKHEHEYKSEITKTATCTEKGIITYSCKCGDSYTEDIKEEEHTYNETGRTAATCTAEGKVTYTCSKCNNSYNETLVALGHTWSQATCTSGSSCTRCGAEGTGAKGHTDNGTGNCGVCGAFMYAQSQYTMAACAYQSLVESVIFPQSLEIYQVFYWDSCSAGVPRVCIFATASNRSGGQGWVYGVAVKQSSAVGSGNYYIDGCYINTSSFSSNPVGNTSTNSIDPGYIKLDNNKVMSAWKNMTW